MDVGKKIKDARQKKGWTQTQLGDSVGVTKSAVMKWEKGIVENIKRSMILKLSDTLDISPLDVLGIEVPPIKQLSVSDLLSEKEKKLLDDFNKLNPVGQEKAAESVHDLTEIPRYRADSKTEEATQEETAASSA